MPVYTALTTSDWATGNAFQGGEIDIDDDDSFKIGAGGANGLSLIKVTTFSSGERIQSCAFIAWATEWPATLDICFQSHTDGGNNQASHEFVAHVDSPNSTPPGNGALTDGKINLWVNYPSGLYIVCRTGYDNNYLSVWHFR